MQVDVLKILFVINPSAGGKAKKDWEAGIRNFFREDFHTIEVFILTGENDAASIQEWIKKYNPTV